MINCNPETVSTDFDMADKLYFEPFIGNISGRSLNWKNPNGGDRSIGWTDSIETGRAFT
jgi:carbamoylphosphate synthase large subunit